LPFHDQNLCSIYSAIIKDPSLIKQHSLIIYIGRFKDFLNTFLQKKREMNASLPLILKYLF